MVKDLLSPLDDLRLSLYYSPEDPAVWSSAGPLEFALKSFFIARNLLDDGIPQSILCRGCEGLTGLFSFQLGHFSNSKGISDRKKLTVCQKRLENVSCPKGHWVKLFLKASKWILNNKAKKRLSPVLQDPADVSRKNELTYQSPLVHDGTLKLGWTLKGTVSV